MVNQSLKLKKGSPLHQKEHRLPLFTNAFLKSWGAHLKHQSESDLWNLHKTPHKHSGVKTSVSSLKIIPKSASKPKPSAFHKRFICGCLSEQAGRHPLSYVRTNLENHDLDRCQWALDSGKTHSREFSC